MSFRKRAAIHLILGLGAGIGFFVAAVMLVLKLAEIGAGPELSWGAVAGALAVGLLCAVGAVFNMFKAVDDV